MTHLEEVDVSVRLETICQPVEPVDEEQREHKCPLVAFAFLHHCLKRFFERGPEEVVKPRFCLGCKALAALYLRDESIRTLNHM